ncbi:MAG: histidine--tRNA ligase [Neisseriaceae bacterium]
MKKYKLLAGMQDLLPEQSYKWFHLEQLFSEWIKSYGYDPIRTPILEATDLFIRTVGEETDIVGKEMYTFRDQSELSVSLRPEGTVPTLRAVVEHHYLYNGPKKLWYYGPMFRRERPQKGRYRQFHQFGVEALGFPGPEIDAEIILMGWDLWKRLGVQGEIILELNSLGNLEERQEYKKVLIDYWEKNKAHLDPDSQRRLYRNPLRLLDTKQPELQALCEEAPRLLDYLGETSLRFYRELRDLLVALGIEVHENPRLMRGLDYYNHTVFEWVTPHLGAQATICAGGRYDGLIQELGGSATKGIGFAIGVERLILLLDTLAYSFERNTPDFYVISQSPACLLAGMQYAKVLRSEGFSVYVHFGGQKLAQQFRKASNLGADYALLIGEEELKENKITFKDLRGEKGQVTVSGSGMLASLKKWMG